MNSISTYSTNKSADTRFKNDQIRASNAGINQPAQNPIQKQAQAQRSIANLPTPTTPNVGAPVSNPVQSQPSGPQSPVQNREIVASPEMALDTLYNDAAFENFLSSPDVQLQIARQKLRNHFKGTTGDPASFAASVLDSMPDNDS